MTKLQVIKKISEVLVKGFIYKGFFLKPGFLILRGEDGRLFFSSGWTTDNNDPGDCKFLYVYGGGSSDSRQWKGQWVERAIHQYWEKGDPAIFIWLDEEDLHPSPTQGWICPGECTTCIYYIEGECTCCEE